MRCFPFEHVGVEFSQGWLSVFYLLPVLCRYVDPNFLGDAGDIRSHWGLLTDWKEGDTIRRKSRTRKENLLCLNC